MNKQLQEWNKKWNPNKRKRQKNSYWISRIERMNSTWMISFVKNW